MLRLDRQLLIGLLVLNFSTHVLGGEKLYDASAGTLPTEQGWLYLTRPLFGVAATQAFRDGAAVLDTMQETRETAGYFSQSQPKKPVLDREAGYAVRFTVRLAAERHRSQHRAGFSVLVLSSDTRGIELAFWEDEIWAQSGPDFKHAEGIARDTTAALTSYELRVAGDRYTLLAKGKPILNGPLRDYSSHWHPVYRMSNLLFFGDDTNSAAARVELGSLELVTGQPATVGQ
jgi:hypothetical protein